ncbi:MFS general substrate transporter [Penicillium coprophilum]|uniref:MFS general substrate transporter n=1 Tax=Penicillium coprophilum TaxID=36646 RepID=UPI002390BDAD|nr:MFS general substrate transporter [Penicillium coprophilum]KAJ5177671.1 MFS general substrate transporter [Penicillium coprophilum]
MEGAKAYTSSPPDSADKEPALKTASKALANEAQTVPNGGATAWLQVLGTFFVFFNTWGILNTFGAYQTYYETGKLYTASSSNISWIGSVQSSLLLLLGLATGPLYDAGYFRTLLYSGSFLILLGQMMTSLCHEYYQALLAQGFCIGIGVGLIFIPGVAILSTYFSSKLALANGIAAAGSGLVLRTKWSIADTLSSAGGILYPIIFHKLCSKIGFGWTVRAIGLVIFLTLLIPLSAFRVRLIPSSKRKPIDLPAFKEPAYVFFVMGGLLTFISLNIPFFYIQSYGQEKGIPADGMGFYLLSIITTGSVFGRIFPNFFANQVGPFNIISLCTIVCGALMFALVNLSSLAGMVVVSLLYGFFSGAFVSLPPTCFVHLSPDRSLIGTRMGMGYATMTIGNLIGTPVAGAILQSKGFNSMWIFGGIMSIAGGLTMMVSRNIQGGGNHLRGCKISGHCYGIQYFDMSIM